ncbi:MAG: YihY/virulence factor BrkB family protein [Bacteroidales bacterium]|nr:YihY/virulence factor BrkB family protein [Bacteroidales bacterium]
MANPVLWVMEQIKRLNYIIWHTPLSEISRGKTFLFKQLKILMLAARGFLNDKVQLRASALTFYSLLSIIPVAAIAFAIAKGFSLDENLKELITDKFQAQQEVLNWVLKNAMSAIEETRGGPIAGVGVVVLFWSVMSLLNRIETSFNHIWQVRSSRPWYRKFTDYLTIMLIAPVFIILSSSIKVFISTELAEFMVRAPILDFFKPVISSLIKFTPYLISWTILTILFIIMPNAKVKFVPAMISGIIAGTILQILLWVYLDLQFGIAKLSAIYGSFAAVPLLLILLQSSWIVVLLGAELTFANQNFAHYELESLSLNISNYQKRAVVIMVLHMIIRNFAIGEKPISAETIAHSLKIPVRLARDVLQDLTNAQLVSVLHENEHKERLYQPAMDINIMSISFVFSKLDKRGIGQIFVSKNRDYTKVIAILDKFDRFIAKSDSNILIKDL